VSKFKEFFIRGIDPVEDLRGVIAYWMSIRICIHSDDHQKRELELPNGFRYTPATWCYTNAQRLQERVISARAERKSSKACFWP